MPKTVNQRHAEFHIRPTRNPPRIYPPALLRPFHWAECIATRSRCLNIRTRECSQKIKAMLYSENEEADDLRDWES